MVRTISTKLAVEGEAQFKQSIAACNAELKTLKSDLALVESEFRSNANSMEALTAKGAALQAVYDKQLEKVAELETAMLNCRNSVTEYAERQDDLKAKLEASGEELGSLDEASKKAGEQWLQYAEKVKKSESALEALKQKSGDTSAEQGKLEDAIAKAKAQMERLETSTGGTAKQAAELIRQNKNLNSEYADNEARLAAAERGVRNWQNQLNSAKIELNGLSDKIAQNDQYLQEAEQSADGCARSIDQYGKTVRTAGESSEEFAQGAQQSRQGIEQLAAALAAAGVAKTVKEIADELLNCANSAAGLETAMAKLSTLMAPFSMEHIKTELLELSDETGVAVGALAEAAYLARSAGVDAAGVVDFVATATKTSVAGFTDSAAAVDVLTTALNAYHMQGSQAEKVASMLVKTQDEGKTSVNELAQNMGRVIPIAASYKVSLGNLTTAYALLTKSGTNTSIATTNLSAMLTELAKDGAAVADVLQEQTGKSFSELMASGEDLGGIMAILSDSVDGDATAFSNLWSSTTAGQAALSLLNSGAEEFARTLNVMETSSGAVERNFQTMADTTEFAQQRMTNAAQNLRIAIGDQLNPALEDLYDTGADAFTWATEFVSENEWVVSAIVGLTGALGALVVGVGALAAAPAIIGALNTALGLLSANPAALVVTAIVGLTAAVATWAASVDDTDESVKKFTESLQESKQAYEDLMDAMEERQGSTKATADALKDLLAVEDKSAVQKDEILALIEQLNEAVPGLNLAYDEEKDALVGLTEAEVESAIERAAAQEKYQADMERLAELRTEGAQIAQNLKDAETELAEAQAENGQGFSSYAEAASYYGSAIGYVGWNIGDLEGNVQSLTDSLDANRAEIAALEEKTAAYSEQQATAAEKVSAMTTRVDELIEDMENLSTTYEENYNAAYEGISGAIGLFNEMDASASTSIDNLIGALESQVAYMDTYAANIQRAMEMGVDEGLVKELSDGSQESAQILASIVEGGEDKIAELNEQFAKVQKGKKTFSDNVAQLKTDFDKEMGEMVDRLEEAIEDMDLHDEAYKAGVNDIQGLIDGMESKRGEAIATAISIAQDVHAAYLREQDQHSPSKKFAKAGANDIQGLIEGAESKRASLSAAYESLAKTAMESYAAGAQNNLEAVAEAMDQFDAALKDLDSFYGLRSDVGDLEYQLWERTDGKNASEAEKYVRQLELLNQQQADQEEKVKAAAAVYETAVELYGEGAQGSYEYQKALLQEQLALQDLLEEINEVNAARQQMYREQYKQQAELNWQMSGVGRASAVALAQGYITPQEVAEIANIGIVSPEGYERVVQEVMNSKARHLPSTLEEPKAVDSLGRQMEAMTAGVINAVSDMARNGGAGTERVRIITVDGKVLAEAVFDDLTDYGDANGTPILNNRR